MTNLPTQPSAQLATRSDIDRIEDRFDRMESRLDQLTIEVRGMHAAMRDQLRIYTLTAVASMTALTGTFAVIVAIIR